MMILLLISNGLGEDQLDQVTKGPIFLFSFSFEFLLKFWRYLKTKDSCFFHLRLPFSVTGTGNGIR